MTKKEEACGKSNELKGEKKAERFIAYKKIQTKKMELEYRNLVIKQACEEEKVLCVNAGNLNTDVAKFAHQMHSGTFTLCKKEGRK